MLRLAVGNKVRRKIESTQECLQFSHRLQVPLPGRDQVFIQSLPFLLRNLQSVPQLLDPLSETFTCRLVFCFTFLQLQDQHDV